MLVEAVWDRKERAWVPVGPSDTARRIMRLAAGTQMVLMPARVLAQSVAVSPSTNSFANVLAAALNVCDYLMVGVTMYAGGCWMFGDRTRAMQHLIGGGIGYLIIRKAPLIRDFLKAL